MEGLEEHREKRIKSFPRRTWARPARHGRRCAAHGPAAAIPGGGWETACWYCVTC